LRRKCGPNRDEVTGEWRKLQNEELNMDKRAGDKLVRSLRENGGG